MRAAVPTLALALAGCADEGRSQTVDGDVEGAPVEVMDAAYFHLDDAFGEDDAIVVRLVAADEACDALTEFTSEQRALSVDGINAEEADLLADTWAALFPEDHWSITVRIRVPDSGETFDEAAFDGVDVDATPEKGDEFAVDVVEYRRLLDDDFFTGEREEAVYQEAWVNDEGTLTLTRDNRGDTLSGELSVDVVDADDGSLAGMLDVSFEAAYCEALEQAGR